jgi:hypothetical protein
MPPPAPNLAQSSPVAVATLAIVVCKENCDKNLVWDLSMAARISNSQPMRRGNRKIKRSKNYSHRPIGLYPSPFGLLSAALYLPSDADHRRP